MKLTDFSAHLVRILDRPLSEFTELRRALAEQSSHFRDDDEELRKELPMLDREVVKSKPGPGGTIDVDPFRAAFVVLALMVDGPRRDIALRTWKAWHLNQHGSVLAGWGDDWKPTIMVCPLTNRHLFGDALRSIFSDVDLAVRVDEIKVSSNRTAEIRFDKTKVSKFDKSYNRDARTALRTDVILSGSSAFSIAMLLK